MEHPSQHGEREVTQGRMWKRLQDSLHQQQLKMTLAQLVHMVEHSLYLLGYNYISCLN